MWVASTHSRAGLIKLEEQGWVSLWILYDPQSPRPHGDRTPVRPHKVSHKVRIHLLTAITHKWHKQQREVQSINNLKVIKNLLVECLRSVIDIPSMHLHDL